MKKMCTVLLILIFVSEGFGTSSDHFERKHRHKKNQAKQHKNFKGKSWPTRCNIICPIEIMNPPPGYYNGSNVSVRPISSVPAYSTTKVPPTKHASNNTTKSPGHSRNLNKRINNLTNGLTKLFGSTIPKILRDTLNNYHHQQVLYKQLLLGNRNGKKPYRFREIQPLGCFVSCNEILQMQSTPSPPAVQGSTNQEENSSESEESEEEGYQEGEDTPIEVTIRPAALQSKREIGYVRPFGQVDFIGLDDFGPDGQPARDNKKNSK